VKDLLSFLTALSKTSSHTCIKRAQNVIIQASVVNSTMNSTRMRIVHVRVFEIRIPNLISGFRREVDENCALLGHYAASSGNSLPTFRANQSVPSSGVKNPKEESHCYAMAYTNLGTTVTKLWFIVKCLCG